MAMVVLNLLFSASSFSRSLLQFMISSLFRWTVVSLISGKNCRANCTSSGLTGPIPADMDTLLGFPYFLSRFRAHFPDKYGGRVDMAVHIAPHLPPFFKDFSDRWGEFMRRNDTLGQGLSLGR